MNILKAYTPVLNNGHGGLINGIYQTAGKRAKHPGKHILYEGVYNRLMVQLIMWELYLLNIPFFKLVPEDKDISLRERTRRFDKIYKRNPKTYHVGIHGNAGRGIGIEGFTTKGKTLSDPLCDKLLSDIEKHFSEVTKMRFDMTDGDRDKEKNFNMLQWPKGPSMILELGFMDNIRDYKFMMDYEKQKTLAKTIANSMSDIYRNGINY